MFLNFGLFWGFSVYWYIRQKEEEGLSIIFFALIEPVIIVYEKIRITVYEKIMIKVYEMIIMSKFELERDFFVYIESNVIAPQNDNVK